MLLMSSRSAGEWLELEWPKLPIGAAELDAGASG